MDGATLMPKKLCVIVAKLKMLSQEVTRDVIVMVSIKGGWRLLAKLDSHLQVRGCLLTTTSLGYVFASADLEPRQNH